MRKPPAFQVVKDLEAVSVLVAWDLFKNRRRLPNAKVCFVDVSDDITKSSPRLIYGLKKAATSLGFTARDATDCYSVNGRYHSRGLKVSGFTLSFHQYAVKVDETIKIFVSSVWGMRAGLAWEYTLKKKIYNWQIVKSEIVAQF